MQKKIAEEFDYDGLGFPIKLLHVPVRRVRGVTVPDVDYNQLQKDVLQALGEKSDSLTGNEVRFIRQYFRLTYQGFADKLGVTHATVINWENYKDSIAKITPTTELCIRLYLLDSLKISNQEFRRSFQRFSNTVFRRRRGRPAAPHVLTVKPEHKAVKSAETKKCEPERL